MIERLREVGQEVVGSAEGRGKKKEDWKKLRREDLRTINSPRWSSLKASDDADKNLATKGQDIDGFKNNVDKRLRKQIQRKNVFNNLN